MSYINDILLDKDRRVRIYLDGIAVNASILQSVYSRFPNFLNHFTVTSSTIGNIKTYNIQLKYPGYVIPQEGGVNQGTVQRPLNFNDQQFNVDEVVATPGSYDISDTAWGKALVNAFTTPHKLNFIGTTPVEDIANDKVDITITDLKAAIFNNSIQVGTVGRRFNFLGTGHSIVEDATANDRWDIDLAYLPNPLNKQYGIYRFAGEGDGYKEGIFGGFDINDSGGGVTDVGDDADGVFVSWETGGEDNNYMEITSSPNFMTRRDYNPHFWGKLKILTTGFRFFAGLHGADPLPNDNNVYLANDSGIGFSYSTDVPADTNYQLRINDADATEDKINMGVAFAANTLVSFHLWGNSAGWFWSINNGAASAAITTEVPAAATRMAFTTRLEEIGGTEQQAQIYYLYYLADK